MACEVLITEIQRFAVNDGPGFRTNVFLKGCTMSCAWCHNPETIHPGAEIYWKRRMCVQCGACMDACPKDAINPPIPPEEAQREGSTYEKIMRERCDLCMECVNACSFGALEKVGKPMTVEEILAEVMSDKPFYDNSGGGMTLSGGEPARHPEFAARLLSEARKSGLHICLDTNGFCEWEILQSLADRADIVLYDLKHLDPDKHQQMTGVDNGPVLRNLERLASRGPSIWVRIPVVPGFNNDIEFHHKAAKYLSGIKGRIERVDLLPFHNWCQDKYGWLGVDWSLKDTEALEPYLLEPYIDLYSEKGLFATVGGSGFEQAGNKAGSMAG